MRIITSLAFLLAAIIPPAMAHVANTPSPWHEIEHGLWASAFLASAWGLWRFLKRAVAQKPR